MPLLLLGLVVVAIVVLTPLADRLRLPQPLLLTVFGLGLPLVPGVPSPDLPADLLLPLVLPPLLFAATQRSSAREFRDNARPIFVLAVGLTVVTTVVVAAVAHAVGVGWGPALVLGAVVSPPDPVAATAVARRLRLPDRLVTVLEGEGMFNDATALVLYSVAVAAVVAGQVGAGTVTLRLVLAVVAGIGVGLAAGALTRVVVGRLEDASAQTTVTVAIPFAAYLGAEHVHGSGVLAVLTLGLFLRSYGHRALTSAGWLLGRAVWRYADYVITSLVFVLIGFELTTVLQQADVDAHLRRLTLLSVGTLVLLRIAWMYPAVALSRLWRRRRPERGEPVGMAETTVVAWAGMRGVVTVATALALPATTAAGGPFPARADIVLVGLVTVLVTLVVQGLTLAPLIRLLGVGGEGDPTLEVAELRRRAAQAALDEVRAVGDEEPAAVRRAVTLQYEGYLAAQGALEEARRADGPDLGPRLEALLRRAGEAERGLVLRARAAGEVSAAATDEVLEDVESRAVRDLD